VGLDACHAGGLQQGLQRVASSVGFSSSGETEASSSPGELRSIRGEWTVLSSSSETGNPRSNATRLDMARHEAAIGAGGPFGRGSTRHVRRFAAMSGVFLTASLAAGQTLADGGLIVEEVYTEEHPGATQESAALDGSVDSSGQRAVLWLNDDGCWDMYLDPGTIDTAGAAWVLPLPVNPVVEPASPDFIDELDAATLPLLITEHITVVTYYTSSGESDGHGFGCASSATLSGGDFAGEETIDDGEDHEAVEPPVQVWQRGRLGDVGYEVVTSDDPSALEIWLGENGYVVPHDLDEHLAEYVAEDSYFFVARIVNEAEERGHLPVFRFTLCGVDSPSYPMRLSRLSVATELAFTLWMVLPATSPFYAPTNAALGRFEEFYSSELTDWDTVPDFDQLYADRRDELLSSPRGLAVEFASALTRDAIERRIEVLDGSSSDLPLEPDSSSWTEELGEISTEGLRVMRLSGRFPTNHMTDDIFFEERSVFQEDDGVYTRTVTSYVEEWTSDGEGEEEPAQAIFDDAGGSCTASGRDTDATTVPMLVLISVALVLLCRRSGRS
jgi:hypothetical protein